MFDFDIINFLFLDSDVPQRPSYGVYIYLNLFALQERVGEFNGRNKILTAKFLKQWYGYHKLHKVF